MENREDKGQDNTLAHVSTEQKQEKSGSYDPDRYIPATADTGQEEGVPLEQQQPDKGYSTDPRQGKQSASLHLADEDMDKSPENPEKEAEDLKESYAKSKDNTDQ